MMIMEISGVIFRAFSRGSLVEWLNVGAYITSFSSSSFCCSCDELVDEAVDVDIDDCGDDDDDGVDGVE